MADPVSTKKEPETIFRLQLLAQQRPQIRYVLPIRLAQSSTYHGGSIRE